LKRFLKSKDGNFSFLALIILVVIVFVSLGVYTGSMIYTNYYSAQLCMERSIDSAVEEFLKSYEVKDVVVRVDPEAMVDMIADNMLDNGLTAQENGYVLQKGDTTVYGITDVDVTGTSEYVTVSGTFNMPMPWGIAQGTVWEMPVSATGRLIYISRAD
jgi:hypothetical protein